jgi:Spy/CpxP family protein refolding chaperone
MLKCLSIVLMFATSLVMVSRLSAQDAPKRGLRTPGSVVDQLGRAIAKLNLTDDQKAKFAELKKEYEPKFKAAGEAVEKVNITAEQRKARWEAVQAAHAAGKKPEEATAAGVAAMNLTADQKPAIEAIETLGKEFHEKVLALLTPEQKEQLEKMRGERAGRRARAEN